MRKHQPQQRNFRHRTANFECFLADIQSGNESPRFVAGAKGAEVTVSSTPECWCRAPELHTCLPPPPPTPKLVLILYCRSRPGRSRTLQKGRLTLRARRLWQERSDLKTDDLRRQSADDAAASAGGVLRMRELQGPTVLG